jgi:predicted TIM-barrel fold metal-dependent hydrolase
MDFDTLTHLPIFDAHIHLPHPALRPDLEAVIEGAQVQRVTLLSTPDPQLVNHNPALIGFKHRHPEWTYLCGALDYFSVRAAPEQMPQALAVQVETLKLLGFDGLKMLEGKPMVRQMLGFPLDGPVYAEMWPTVELLGLPVVWHAADPEEFWDPERCPVRARESGFFYGDGTVPPKEVFYREVETVLTRWPGLRVVLAHFFFLSNDLKRAATFLEAHPGVFFDLTPGAEMYFNFNSRIGEVRDFFLRYQDRLIYGTDIGASALLQDPAKGLDRAEALGRAWVVRKFLESEGTVELPPGVRNWAELGPPLPRGIALPAEALEKLYWRNAEQLFGSRPAPLNCDAALAELERLAVVMDAVADGSVENAARHVAHELADRRAIP